MGTFPGIKDYREFQQKMTDFFMNKFSDSTRDKNEKYGDFYITTNGLTGFEVYTPRMILSLSSMNLKEETHKNLRSKDGIINAQLMGGGLSRKRTKEAIEKALENKSHQFCKEKVKHKKILILNLASGHFTQIDLPMPLEFRGSNNIPLSNVIDTDIQHNPHCSAVILYGGGEFLFINTKNAIYPLDYVDIQIIKQAFNKIEIVSRESWRD